ncbi:MAG: DinB family protein [Candidatus Methylomirabilota bacterium]
MGTDGSVREWTSAELQEIWNENSAARATLRREVHGLSEEQLAFQPASGKWSIGEILDHLHLAERSFTRVLSKLLQQAAGRGLIGEPGSMEPLPYQIDREIYNQPADAPESVRPSPDRSLSQLLDSLEESRERLREVASRADGRVVGNVTIRHFQLGELHFYQWLALEAAHETKHLAQIRRIKVHPRFPKT